MHSLCRREGAHIHHRIPDNSADVFGSSISLVARCLGSAPARRQKPNTTKHGKQDLRRMANIGRRCAVEVAERSIPDQNRPPNRFMASALAVVNYPITDIFGFKVERHSTPRNYTRRGTPPYDPQISLRYPAEDVSRAV